MENEKNTLQTNAWRFSFEGFPAENKSAYDLNSAAVVFRIHPLSR
jgi:hypothetical protein